MAPINFPLGAKIIYLDVIFKLLIIITVNTVKLEIKHEHKYRLFIQKYFLKILIIYTYTNINYLTLKQIIFTEKEQVKNITSYLPACQLTSKSSVTICTTTC